MNTVSIKGFFPDCAPASENAVIVTLGDRTLRIEDFAYGNTSGGQIMDEDTSTPFDFDVELDTYLYGLLDDLTTRFYAKWQERVAPLIQGLIAEVVAETDPAKLTIELEQGD